MKIRHAFVILCAAAAALLGGCGKSTTKPQAKACISGTVRRNGAPVAGARVVATGGASATTDTAGHYCLEAPAQSSVAVIATFTDTAPFRASATLTTGAASNCGGSCTPRDLDLIPLLGPRTRFNVTASVARIDPDSGIAVCAIYDDSLARNVSGAVVTITPQGGSTVRLT